MIDGHLRGPETLTPVAERFALELSLPVLTTQVCSGCDSNTQPSAFGAIALTSLTCDTFCLFDVVAHSLRILRSFGIITIGGGRLQKSLVIWSASKVFVQGGIFVAHVLHGASVFAVSSKVAFYTNVIRLF